MTSYHMQMLFNLLPQELKEKAISLEEFGLNEYIWKWHDTLQLIEILSNKQKFILGGDVISNYDGKYKETDDGILKKLIILHQKMIFRDHRLFP